MGQESEREEIHVKLNHFAVHLKHNIINQLPSNIK